jgi:hypothetical protein
VDAVDLRETSGSALGCMGLLAVSCRVPPNRFLLGDVVVTRPNAVYSHVPMLKRGRVIYIVPKGKYGPEDWYGVKIEGLCYNVRGADLSLSTFTLEPVLSYR